MKRGSVSSRKQVTMAQQQFIVMPSEVYVGTFTGSGPAGRLTSFIEELDALWIQRPDIKAEDRGMKAWTHLSEEVRRELRCSGLSAKSLLPAIIGTLKSTYGEKRSVSTLAALFHTCRQEGYEDLRNFSLRLHASYCTLVSAQKKAGLTPSEDSLLSERLVEGLMSESLQFHLRQQRILKPDITFIELRTSALQLEGPVPSPPSPLQPAVNAVNTGLPAPLPPTAATSSVPDVVTETLSKMASTLESLNSKLDSLTVGHPNTRHQSEGRNRRCFICNDVGHFAKDCPNPRPPPQHFSRPPPRQFSRPPLMSSNAQQNGPRHNQQNGPRQYQHPNARRNQPKHQNDQNQGNAPNQW